MPYFDIPQRRVLERSPNVTPDTAFAEVAMTAARGVAGNVSKYKQHLQKEKIEQEKVERFETDIALAKSRSSLAELGADLERQKPGKGLHDAYQETKPKFIEDQLANIPESQRQYAERELTVITESYSRSIQSRENALVADGMARDLEDQSDVIRNQIQAGVTDYKEGLEALLKPIESLRAINPKAADVAQSQIIDGVLSSEFMRSINTEGYAATKARYESDEFDQMSPELGEQLLKQAKSSGISDIKEAISYARESVAKGQMSVGLDVALREAEALGEVELAEDIRSIKSVENKSYVYLRQNTKAQNKKLLALEEKAVSEGLTKDEQLEYQAYLSNDRYKSTMLNSNPWGFFQMTDQIPEDMTPLPLDPSSSAEEISSALLERKRHIQFLSDEHGIKNMPLFINEELSTVQAMASAKSPAAYAEQLSFLGQAYPEHINTISTQINKKDKNLAAHIGLASFDPELVVRVKRGMSLPPGAVKEPEKKDWQRATAPYALAGVPGAQLTQIMDQAKFLYRDYASQEDSPDKQSLLEKVMVDLAGPLMTLPNGTTAISFREKDTGAYISERDVNGAINHIKPGDLEAMGLPTPKFNGTPIDPKAMFEWGQIVPISAYSFGIRKRGTNEMVWTDKGPLKINMAQLVATVRQKRTENLNVSPLTGADVINRFLETIEIPYGAAP